MKRQILSVLLVLALALGLCAGAAAAEAGSAAGGAVSVRGLTGGQRAFVAGYDARGRFLGARVLTADGDARPIPGAEKMKVFRTDDTFAPQGETVSLPDAYQTVRKIDGHVVLCYEGPDGVSVTQTVTRKVTGTVFSHNITSGEVYITNRNYSATTLAVEGCDYDVSRDGFGRWPNQPGLPDRDTLNFYLDPWGNICWIEMVEEYQYPVDVCLLLSAGVTDGGAVQVELLHSNGSVSTPEVTILDGRSITEADAAAAQLSAHAPDGYYSCQRQRDGGFAMTTMDSGWGATLIIPPAVVTAPAADFTGGAVNCVADGQTLFVLSRGLPGEEEIVRCEGYQNLPVVPLVHGVIVTAEGDSAATPVARLVYLRTLEVALPGGCVFPFGSGHPDPDRENVYRVSVMGADGAPASILVTEALAAENTYVHKFCAITKMNKKAGVVSALEVVDMAEVSALGAGVITTSAGSWTYNGATQGACVDYGRQGTLAGYGRIYPESFPFDPGDVSADPMSGATYRRVKAAVIPSAEDPTHADYIYVIREMW